jgi:hypothetical protein
VKKPKIRFSLDENFTKAFPEPERSIRFVPKWFKRLKEDFNREGHVVRSVKACIPFLDVMQSGFIIPAWCDFQFEIIKPIEVYVHGLADPVAVVNPRIGLRPEFKLGATLQDGTIISRIEQGKIPKLFFTNVAPQGWTYDSSSYNHAFHPTTQVNGLNITKIFPSNVVVNKFNSPWFIKTPKGYSCYFKNPPNVFDRKIELFEAIVDTDNYFDNTVNFPFVCREEKEGIFHIEQGEPLIHVFPFKRETLDKEVGNFDPSTDTAKKMHGIMSFAERNRYKKHFWSKTREK